jgi:hypothetical protein
VVVDAFIYASLAATIASAFHYLWSATRRKGLHPLG